MRFALNIVVAVFLLSSFATAQDLNRERAVEDFKILSEKMKALEPTLLRPDALSVKQASEEGVNVFRLLPREKYDERLTIRGGGSYYSFTTLSHDYNKVPQVGLEQKHLKTGFAGGDHGFIADLGDIPLDEVTLENAQVFDLARYNPAVDQQTRTEMRQLQYTSRFRNRVPATLGHTYVIRAVSYDVADVLVAVRIIRADADGSMIVFWKLLGNFEKPSSRPLAENSR